MVTHGLRPCWPGDPFFTHRCGGASRSCAALLFLFVFRIFLATAGEELYHGFYILNNVVCSSCSCFWLYILYIYRVWGTGGPFLFLSPGGPKGKRRRRRRNRVARRSAKEGSFQTGRKSGPHSSSSKRRRKSVLPFLPSKV